MKKIIKISMLSLAVSLFTVLNSKAQEIIVRTRLHRPERIFVRPIRPTPHHIWVAGEWAPGGGTYVYHQGY